MWSRLGVWKKRQMVAVAALSAVGAVMAAEAGAYIITAAMLMLPVIDVVETWGALHRDRRRWKHWMLLASLMIVIAILLGAQVLASEREAREPRQEVGVRTDGG